MRRAEVQTLPEAGWEAGGAVRRETRLITLPAEAHKRPPGFLKSSSSGCESLVSKEETPRR